MNADHLRDRLHDAMHRGHGKVTEQELADVAAVVLAIATEISAELALVIADLAGRIELLEASNTSTPPPDPAS